MYITRVWSPSDLTIYSRIEGGPDNVLRAATVQAFTGFKNSKPARRILKKVPLDGRRASMLLVSYDQAYTENEDFKRLGL
jgi:hypothetical protein